MDDEISIGEWLGQAKKRIDTLDAELIALECFAASGADRSWLVAHCDDLARTGKRMAAEDLVAQRQDGVPLAYVLGFREFYGRNFTVSQDVLIPRTETETLIDLVKGLNLPKQARFLEIGTGSGCIAVTLALEFPQSLVMATDVSEQALAVAEENNEWHEGRVKFVWSNLLQDLDYRQPLSFDVVVANLPYVNKEWNWIDRRALNHEPRTALYVEGENGLALYRRFFCELRQRRENKELSVEHVVVEADLCQHQALITMAEEYGLKHIKTEGYGVLFGREWMP